MDPADPTSPRQPDGRFAIGNPGGPGRPKGRRSTELQRAAQEAITADHMGLIMRKALRMALEGNLTAMKFVADRACGKVPELPVEAEPLDIALPNLRTVASCTAAIDKVASAVTTGAVDQGTAKLLLDVIQTRLKAIEVTDLEARLVELEKAAASVELGTRRF